jgi:hypothetical protein
MKTTYVHLLASCYLANRLFPTARLPPEPSKAPPACHAMEVASPSDARGLAAPPPPHPLPNPSSNDIRTGGEAGVHAPTCGAEECMGAQGVTRLVREVVEPLRDGESGEDGLPTGVLYPRYSLVPLDARRLVGGSFPSITARRPACT